MCNDKCKEKKGGSLKCVIGGMLAGAVVSAVGILMMTENKRTLKKKADKVADAMENLANSTMNLFQ